jgi:hypothetical protein
MLGRVLTHIAYTVAAMSIGIALLLIVPEWLAVSLGCLLFLVGVPTLILLTIDLGRKLRGGAARPLARFFGFALSVPQALLGVFAVFLGVAIVAWVLYRALVEPLDLRLLLLPTFGIGPALIVFGVQWIKTAFSDQERDSEMTPEAAAANPDKRFEPE